MDERAPPDAFPGLQIAHFYEAAWDEALVGGDFYDLFALRDHKVALVVGDVAGKGLAAASYTAEIKFSLRSLLREFFLARRAPRPPEVTPGRG